MVGINVGVPASSGPSPAFSAKPAQCSTALLEQVEEC
jgi:hypothetical protein